MSISGCGTVILHIHTPYVVSKGISGDRGGVFGENSYVGEKCQFPVERTVILHIHTPYVVIFKSPATEGGNSAKIVSSLRKCQFPVERTVILRIHTPYVSGPSFCRRNFRNNAAPRGLRPLSAGGGLRPPPLRWEK